MQNVWVFLHFHMVRCHCLLCSDNTVMKYQKDQWSVIQVLGLEFLKTRETDITMTVQYGSNYMNQRKVLFKNGWKGWKEGWKYVVDDTCLGCPWTITCWGYEEDQ